VARAIVDRYEKRAQEDDTFSNNGYFPVVTKTEDFDPFAYTRRETFEIANLGDHNVPRIVIDLSEVTDLDPLHLKAVDFHYDAVSDKWNMGEQGSDYLYFGMNEPSFMLPNGTKGVFDYKKWLSLADRKNNFPVLDTDEYLGGGEKSPILNFVRVVAEEATTEVVSQLGSDNTVVILAETREENAILALHQLFTNLLHLTVRNPVIIVRTYTNSTHEEFLLQSAADAGSLLLDGFGDGLFVNYKAGENILSATNLVNKTVFYILQASRTRISKTEYISCPSCGRTLFDLQETTAMIRKETDHLKGVKIAIMGCIVNGPGEMADADYGYVGTGPGKITLYRGKEVVKRNLPETSALDELISLIKEDDNWIEKQ
jgi:(E)-4-hydroxy-3-methylbut-2-enyl-diphosphate synthase